MLLFFYLSCSGKPKLDIFSEGGGSVLVGGQPQVHQTEPTDTAMDTDTGDTGDTEDTGDTGDTGDTEDSDTADSADTNN